MNPFWLSEGEALFTLLFPIAKQAALKASEQALKTLEVEFGVVFSSDFVNEEAVKLAKNYTYDLVTGLTKNTQAMLQEIHSKWIESGESIENLFDNLIPIFGETRAEAIGITEITRIFADANIQTWKMSEMVSSVKWMTAEDDLVCPICEPLDGQITKIDDQFEGGLPAPPAHVRCRCWVHPVL